MAHGDNPWMVHAHGGGGGAGDLSSTGSGLTPAFGAGLLLLLLSLRDLSPLGSDTEHCSASLGTSPSAPLLWSESWARERTSCRTAVVLKHLRSGSL